MSFCIKKEKAGASSKGGGDIHGQGDDKVDVTYAQWRTYEKR